VQVIYIGHGFHEGGLQMKDIIQRAVLTYNSRFGGI